VLENKLSLRMRQSRSRAISILASSIAEDPGPEGFATPNTWPLMYAKRSAMMADLLGFILTRKLIAFELYSEESPETECCLLVLNLVSSTLPCIRQLGPRLRVLGVCDFV
jgi:hypothetical protein